MKRMLFPIGSRGLGFFLLPLIFVPCFSNALASSSKEEEINLSCSITEDITSILTEGNHKLKPAHSIVTFTFSKKKMFIARVQVDNSEKQNSFSRSEVTDAWFVIKDGVEFQPTENSFIGKDGAKKVHTIDVTVGKNQLSYFTYYNISRQDKNDYTDHQLINIDRISGRVSGISLRIDVSKKIHLAGHYSGYCQKAERRF